MISNPSGTMLTGRRIGVYKVQTLLGAGGGALWSDTGFAVRPGMQIIALHPDGDRFAISPEQEGDKKDKVVFVYNFFDELRRIAPPSRK